MNRFGNIAARAEQKSNSRFLKYSAQNAAVADLMIKEPWMLTINSTMGTRSGALVTGHLGLRNMQPIQKRLERISKSFVATATG